MTTDNDLDWLAFCYAAGELNAAEAEAFEQRLEADQPAREALARAVELIQVVAAAEAQPAVAIPKTSSRSTWQTRVAWMAVGGLASVLAALLITGALQRAWRLGSPSQHALQLAAAWSETRAQLKSDTELGLWASEPPRAEFDDDLLATAASPMDEILEETPSWLDAALGIGPTSTDDTQTTSDASSGD